MLDWRPFFPEKEPRPSQVRLLDELTANFSSHDYFVVEAPPGIGKSAVAVCLGRWLAAQEREKTYITTVTVELQQQSYEKPYGKLGLTKLYSADRFKCHQGGGLTCGDGNRTGDHSCSENGQRCPYKTAKEELMKSDVGVLNMAYYMHETTYGGQLLPRGLLICDEAHAIPENVMSFVALRITDEAANELSLDLPTSTEVKTVLRWLRDEYEPRLVKLDVSLRSERDALMKKKLIDAPLFKKCTNIDKHLCSVHRTVQNAQDDWVVDNDKESFTLTPLSARSFAHGALFKYNKRHLLMTATVLDKNTFLHELGLEDKKVFYISLDSPFKPENRKTYYLPTCKLKHNDLVKTTEDLTKGVRIILDHHPDEHGIIFVSSYSQAHELIRQMKDTRLMTHVNADDKKRLMKLHSKCSNSVIVSPSMHVGVDLKDDLSRFQVIAKLPFPSLGLTSVKKHAELDPRWYAYRTALTLIQATGRSVRSDTDSAVTYILDKDFGWFYSRWADLFPSWWKQAYKS